MESPERPAHIYAFTQPDTGDVRYIGQARHLWRRYAHHLLFIQGTPAKRAWLQGVHRRRLLPGVRVLEQVSADDADAREGWWVEYYRRQGAMLVNGPLGRPDTVRRTSARQRRHGAAKTQAKVVRQGVQGRPVAERCHAYQISQALYSQWRDQCLAHADKAFEVHPQARNEAQLERENATLKGLVGAWLLE